MNESDRKYYLKDWVANYEICDYLSKITDKAVNQNLFFFRQSAYDHPDEMDNLKF
jgi:hypothetical protein